MLVQRGRRKAGAVENERRRHLVFPIAAVRKQAVGTHRKRLRRRSVEEFVLRDLPILDGKQRLARFTIEQEQIAVGAHGRERLTPAPSLLCFVEEQRRGDIRVP